MGIVTDIDGNTYDTVVIGNQEWTVQNFKCTKLNDGTSISLVTTADWSGLTTPAYCYYNNDAATNSATYGALYNWFTFNTGKLAPVGWHVPTDLEWTVLENYLGGASVAGGKLKEVGTAHWFSPNLGATNESGFSALPGGQRVYTSFSNITYFGHWWSSSVKSDDATRPWVRYMSHLNTEIKRYSSTFYGGYSIRCVREAKILSINESQFNWAPPTDYPFTPNNDLYDKDINYIRNNKRKLKPFSGISATPNPGYNYSTYPGYETGLFGYPRKDYLRF